MSNKTFLIPDSLYSSVASSVSIGAKCIIQVSHTAQSELISLASCFKSFVALIYQCSMVYVCDPFILTTLVCVWHDDVINGKHVKRNWPFVWGIHRSPVNSPHKGQWRGALMFSLICAWIHGRANNGEAGDLRRHRAHYDVTLMCAEFYLQRFSVKKGCTIQMFIRVF